MRFIMAVTLIATAAAPLEAQFPVQPKEGAWLNPTQPTPGAPPTGLIATGTPSTADLTWTAPSGWTGFDVHRSVPGGSWTKLTPSPVTTTFFNDRSGFVAGTGYVYRVVVRYVNGTSGYADVSFQPPSPVNPAWVKATLQGKDLVVTWAPVPGAARYAVAGTAAMFREVAAPATSTVYPNVAPGAYEVAVGARFDPGPVETSASAWTRGSITVPASGRYRIVLNGAQVISPTTDDPLSRDGRGDEVYFSNLIEIFDRAAAAPKRKARLWVPNLAASDALARAVYGDAGGAFSSRIRAGSLTPQGGLGAGDVIPMGANVLAPYAQPQPYMLPFLLWEGELTDGREVLLVHPGVSEWDSGQPSSESGFPWEKCPPDQLFESSAVQQELARKGIGAPIVEPVRHTFTKCQRPLEMQDPGPLAGIITDRQIGRLGGINDPNAWFATDTYVVLTREKVESTLGSRPWAMLRIDRIDRFKGGDGHYALYLLVERLP